jgi:hypothetical protein
MYRECSLSFILELHFTRWLNFLQVSALFIPTSQRACELFLQIQLDLFQRIKELLSYYNDHSLQSLRKHVQWDGSANVGS